MIWVSCEGKSPEDKVNAGSIAYLPRQGFPGFYYPCTSEESCTEPLVAINFQKPKSKQQNETWTTKNFYFHFSAQVLINIECKIWAENLQDKIEFELFIE